MLLDQILTIPDLKRELLSAQVRREIVELAHPTALQRFGAPFKSEFGEVAPVDSELPILRFIFVNHVRNFPFLDQAREKEFWQDRLQVVRSDDPRRVGMADKACSFLSRSRTKIYPPPKTDWKKPNEESWLENVRN